MKITSKIFLNPVILFALLLAPGLVGAASTCNHTFFDGVSSTNITYHTLYKGGVSGLEDIDCGETPIEHTFEGSAENRLICFDPNPGFKISNWASPLGDKKVCTEIHTEISPNIEWTGDGDNYPVPFTYTPSEEIGSASPTTCTGGNLYSTACSVNSEYRDTYKVESCPLSSYICPGYGQNFYSYEQYSVDSLPNVVFGEATPPSVTVYGDDMIRDINRQTGQMTVPAPTFEDEANARIYWITKNVTRCECGTSNREVCTPTHGRSTVSTFTGQPVYAQGNATGDGAFSLTEDRTFTVSCD